MMKVTTAALPVDSDGRTYITDRMMVEDPEIRAFYERTRNSFSRDDHRCRYVLWPSIIIDRTPRQRPIG